MSTDTVHQLQYQSGQHPLQKAANKNMISASTLPDWAMLSSFEIQVLGTNRKIYIKEHITTNVTWS